MQSKVSKPFLKASKVSIAITFSFCNKEFFYSVKFKIKQTI